MSYEENNDYIKIPFIIYLIYFSFRIITGSLHTMDAFIHKIDLPIHEFGHVLFSFIFGSDGVMMYLGGNAFQTIFPSILAGSFFKRKDFMGGGFCTLWVGETMIDAGYYISDARTRDLPLITGDSDTHDWMNILLQLKLLAWDETIGGFVSFIGSILMIIGLIICISSLNIVKNFLKNKSKSQ